MPAIHWLQMLQDHCLLQAELTTSLSKAEQESAAVREADQLAGASAAQLAARQAQEQVLFWGSGFGSKY